MLRMSTSMGSRKNFVIDTSVLAHSKEAVHSFDGHNLFIPMEVLEEVDRLKTRKDEVGVACRYVNRFLDKLRPQGKLSEGVRLDNNQIIYVVTNSDMQELPANMSDTVDNRIISVAKSLSKSKGECIVVSRDISLRVRCDSLGVLAENYQGKPTSTDDFAGTRLVEVSQDKIEQFYTHDIVTLDGFNFYPNEGVILRCGQASALAMAEDKRTLSKLRYVKGRRFNVQGIVPRNKEQHFALEMLLDPNISMVTLSGLAGSGKTLLSLAAALEHLQNKTYKKIIVSRPVQSTSKDIGFLPGTKEEKMAPWVQPIFDNLNVLTGESGKSYIKLLMDKGVIEVEALTYIRGRTLPDTIFIIDEAQNITHHEAKALLTRMGENSKIVLLGDLEQIDSPRVNQKTSGLQSVINLFKECEESGHVKLLTSERSKLASYAAKIMR